MPKPWEKYQVQSQPLLKPWEKHQAQGTEPIAVQEKTTVSPPPPPPQQGSSTGFDFGGSKDLSQFVPDFQPLGSETVQGLKSESEAPPRPPELVQKLSQRGLNIGEIFKDDTPVLGQKPDIPTKVFRSTAEVSRGIGDVAGETLGAIGSTLKPLVTPPFKAAASIVPEGVKTGVKQGLAVAGKNTLSFAEGLKEKFNRSGIAQLKETHGYDDATAKAEWEKFKPFYKDAFEVAMLAGDVIGGRKAGKVGKGLLDSAKDAMTKKGFGNDALGVIDDIAKRIDPVADAIDLGTSVKRIQDVTTKDIESLLNLSAKNAGVATDQLASAKDEIIDALKTDFTQLRRDIVELSVKEVDKLKKGKIKEPLREGTLPLDPSLPVKGRGIGRPFNERTLSVLSQKKNPTTTPFAAQVKQATLFMDGKVNNSADKIAGEKVAKALGDVDKTAKSWVSQKNKVLKDNVTKNINITDLKDEWIKSVKEVMGADVIETKAGFEAVEAGADRLLVAPSQMDVVNNMTKALMSAPENMTPQMADDLKNKIWDLTFDTAQKLRPEKAKQLSKTIGGMLNKRLNNELGSGYSLANENLSKIVELQDNIGRRLGKEINRESGLHMHSASIMKRADQSQADSGLRDLFDQIKEVTGGKYDLNQEATYAIAAMRASGDFKSANLLEEMVGINQAARALPKSIRAIGEVAKVGADVVRKSDKDFILDFHKKAQKRAGKVPARGGVKEFGTADLLKSGEAIDPGAVFLNEPLPIDLKRPPVPTSLEGLDFGQLTRVDKKGGDVVKKAAFKPPTLEAAEDIDKFLGGLKTDLRSKILKGEGGAKQWAAVTGVSLRDKSGRAIELNANTKKVLQDVVDAYDRDPESIRRLKDIGIDPPEHFDDIRSWLSDAPDLPKKKRLPGILGDQSGAIGGVNKQVETPQFKKWFGDWRKAPEKASKVVDDVGEPIRVYHGTTHDFNTFSDQLLNAKGDFGKGHYFSNTVDDINANYVGEGPDLSQRIELLKERFEDELGEEEALKKAREMLVGSGPNIKPVYLDMKDPVFVGGDKETIFDLVVDYDDAGDIIDESGLLMDLSNSIEDVSRQFDDIDAGQLISDINEAADYESISASNLVDVMKKSEGLQYATDSETGDMASGEVIRAIFEDMGFDGIVDNTVDIKFGSQRRVGKKMAGMTPETTHYIVFKPNQVKSATGNIGAFDPTNPDIRGNTGLKMLGGTAAAGVGGITAAGLINARNKNK